MACDDGRKRKTRQTIAITLVLCALAQSLTCFSLGGLGKTVKHDKPASEASVMEVETGGSLLNRKELNSQSDSASAAATGNDGLLHGDFDRSDDDTVMLDQAPVLGGNMAVEATWRRLNCSLHCGQSTMTLKATGPGAADLKLDIGDKHPLPFDQVPETCGYSMKQNAPGFLVVVPYGGCNVIQEDGNYVLPVSWLETPIKFMCPMSRREPASTTPKPAHQPWKRPVPLRPWSPTRRKRHALPVYDPRSPYYYWWYYNYYSMYMTTPAPDTSGTKTTAKPDATSTQQPYYPYNPYYPYYYYHYYPYYYHYHPYYTTAKPATTTAPTTTAKPPTMTTTPAPATTAAPATTTAPTTAPTTVTQTMPFTYTYPYWPFYYNPLIQHFYGTSPYPSTQPPTVTTVKPGTTDPTTEPTSTVSPTYMTTASPMTTVSPTSMTTASPMTTVSPTPMTTKRCPQTTKPSGNNYPGPLSPYVPYYQEPFTPYISFNKAGKLPFDQKNFPEASYKLGPQARAHPHPGFNYWQPAPWFPHLTGKDDLPFDWSKAT